MKNSFLRIRNGWFLTAGTRWNWKGDIRGVGIFTSMLEGQGDITIEVEGKRYYISKVKALKLAEKYNSYHRANTYTLAVIPKDELTPVKEESEEERSERLLRESLGI